MIALMMEVAITSETSVNVYQTTRCNNPEDSHLHTRRRDNLKSYLILHHFQGKESQSAPFFSCLIHIQRPPHSFLDLFERK
jgi:hypothetical protein